MIECLLRCIRFSNRYLFFLVCVGKIDLVFRSLKFVFGINSLMFEKKIEGFLDIRY